MGDDLESVVFNIRALLQVNRIPTPVRNLERDYQSMVYSPIPYRALNFPTLESFLESIPTLRLSGSGRDLVVEAVKSEASSHVTDLISKQKNSKKPIPSARRGRGGGFRSRGSYYEPPRRYMPREYPAPSRHYNPPPSKRPYPNKEQDNNTNSSYKENLVVQVQSDDRRQVSHSSAKHGVKDQKSNYELPPRFQRKKSSSTAPSCSSDYDFNEITKDVEETLFLDVPTASHPRVQRLQEIDTNIISALKPSELVAVGRAKEQEAQINGNCFQGAMQKNSNRREALEPALIPAVPTPDDKNIENNITLLLNYSMALKWPVPTYNVFPRKLKESVPARTVYGARVQISKNGQDEKKYSSFPMETEVAMEAKGYAAKKALEELRKEEKVNQKLIISSDKNTINHRISKIVAGFFHGMFAKNVEDMYVKTYNEQLPKDWLQTAMDCPLLSVEPTLTNNTIIIPKEPPAPDLDLDEPLITSVPLNLEPPEEEIWAVFITLATSTSQVWFRLIGENYSEKYEELLTNMEEFYKTNGLSEIALTIEEGQYYAAESKDGWFRVCITSVNDDAKTVEAFLIDHGDNDIFSFQSLYRLPIEFCTLPRQAMMCSLEGLESFSEDPVCCGILASCDYLIGHTLIAKVNSRDEKTASVKVTLFDTSGTDDVNINEKILESLTFDFSDEVPVLPEEGLAVEVSVTHISKYGEVFIQMQNDRFDQMVEIIDSLTPEDINKNKLTSYRHVTLNKIYLAQYNKDGGWYRAVVTATPSVQQNKIALQFVDYGNPETITIDGLVDVDNLPPIISNLPPQSLKVALHNLPIETLSEIQVAKLHSLLFHEDRVILLRKVSMKEGLPIVDMFYKDDGGVGAVVSVNLTVAMETNPQRKSPENDTSNGLPSHLLNGNGNPYTSLKTPELLNDNNNYQEVIILLAANPGNFIFQLKQYVKKLGSLMEDLQSFYNVFTPPELKEDEIFCGGVYAGLYTVDNAWYRVAVGTMPMSGSNIPIQLCDYGNIDMMPISNLRKLDPKFCELPVMGIKGKLAGVRPIHTDWSVDDCLFFKDLVINRTLASYVGNVEDSDEDPMNLVASLHLIDTSSEKDINIAEVLCRQNRAVHIEQT